jgi:transposase
MMGIKVREFRPLPYDTSLEELVPTDNFYRDVDKRLDLSFVREMVAPLYARGGRPSVDPVVFFKLQLVMFFEDLRSERQLMEVVADRISLRWYLGYDLGEPLPDHSSLTRIRDRYGLSVFRRFFEGIVEMCAEAGLVWGEEFYFDATKVEANASLESITPRFAVEQHLQGLFEEGPQEDLDGAPGDTARAAAAVGDLDPLPTSEEAELISANSARSDWISKAGRQDREVKGDFYRRKADLFLSKTDPDASPMKRKGADHSHLGYQAHCVVDGGRARIILGVLVAPFEVTENKPMLDMLWRAAFRWKARPRRVTGDSAYGTVENIAAIEKMGIRAYVALKGAGQGRPFFGKDEFAYDAAHDLYICPVGELLAPRMRNVARRLIGYRAKAGTCDACPLRPKCTPSKLGRQISRHFDEEYVDRVKGYRGTFPYEKALRKRRVWVEPLFAEAKDWHGMRRFRLRGLEKVNAEALLIAAGQNVKRLVVARDRGPREQAQVAALRPPNPASHCRPHLTGRCSSFVGVKAYFNRLLCFKHESFAMSFMSIAKLSRSQSSRAQAVFLRAG